MTIIYPVILSGGSGTRLWPISRSLFPKQFLSLNGKHSFFQETALRVKGFEGFSTPTIICNSEHRFIVKEQLSAIGITAKNIILESKGRNTAAAAAIAAIKISELDPDGLILLLASDHSITKPDLLRTALIKSIPAAKENRLVTFGVRPDRAETGYGYIKIGSSIETIQNCYEVDKFVEKPNKNTAETYLLSGKYLWNSSLFLFNANTYLKELQLFEPEIKSACQTALDEATIDLDFIRLNDRAFSKSPSISIDYAVMEHTSKAVVVPIEPGWSDVGSWLALWEILDKDENQNAILGDVIAQETKGSFIQANSRLITTIGVEDLIISETPDAVLVLHKDYVQDVKQVVDKLKKANRPEVIAHTLVHRPWGNFEIINSGPTHQVKRITVNPGAILSLQTHKQRSEHWVVINGIAKITKGPELNDLKTRYLKPNESIDIPQGWFHRLENNSDASLIIIEVQSGDYLGEDDIERYEDVYGRGPQKKLCFK